MPKKLKSMLTYWPLVNVNDAHFLEKITKLLGRLKKKLILMTTMDSPVNSFPILNLG